MFYRIISFGFLLICVQSINAEIPSYLKVCHKEPEFSTCAVKSGNDALPHLLKGEKKMKIPNMLPMRFPEVDVDAGPTLKIKLFDLDVFGLDTVVLKNVKIDFDKLHVTLFMNAKRAALIGKYEVDGQILVLPIQGNGNLNITIENSDFQYDFNYKLVKKNDVDYAQVLPEDTLEFQIPMAYIQLDNLFNGNKQLGDCTFNYSVDYDLITRKDGKQYAANIRPDISFKINKAHFNFENLFNGNKQLGDNINKVLNDNPQDAINELGPAFSNVINLAATTIIRAYLLVVPFDELFVH